MTPYTYNTPTLPAKCSKVAAIATPIPLDFLLPERRYGILPQRKMPAVPKVSIDENRKFLTRENNVGAPW